MPRQTLYPPYTHKHTQPTCTAPFVWLSHLLTASTTGLPGWLCRSHVSTSSSEGCSPDWPSTTNTMLSASATPDDDNNVHKQQQQQRGWDYKQQGLKEMQASKPSVAVQLHASTQHVHAASTCCCCSDNNLAAAEVELQPLQNPGVAWLSLAASQDICVCTCERQHPPHTQHIPTHLQLPASLSPVGGRLLRLMPWLRPAALQAAWRHHSSNHL